MEVGRKAEESHAGREVAFLLEKCVCPPGTAGLSCQVGDSGWNLVPGLGLKYACYSSSEWWIALCVSIVIFFPF